MATIPLQVANRSLDTGGTVSYPSSTPVADAFSNLGKSLQGVAERVQAKADQHDAFLSQIEQQKFTADLGAAEDQAIENAPADASGLHDSVYGQIDPNTGTAVKPGSFDKLFETYLEKVPESKRAEFIAKKEVFRAQGSARLARSQYLGEQEFYKVEIGKSQNDLANAILQGDPRDFKTYDAYKKQGLDLIEKSGLPEIEKEVAKANWEASAAETLFNANVEKNPNFNGRAALGLAAPTKIAAMAPDQAGRATQALSFFMGKGFTKEQAAGIVGNLVHESGLKPSGAVGDSGTAFGVAQWRGDRLTKLKRFANANGRDWQDFATQLEFVNVELKQDEPTAYANLKRAKTVDEATAAFIGFERPKGWTPENPRGGHGWDNRVGIASKIAGVDAPAPSGADPAFANIPADRRLALANAADVQVAERQRTVDANIKADYTSHKDAMELSIVQGQTVDEGLIANDNVLNDGDKATLIRSLRAQNETTNQLSADLGALSSGSLVLDPYASKDKTRADNIYSDAIKRVPAEQQSAVASAIIEQTGVVPQPVVNTIRRGLSSQSPTEVAQAAQLAQRIASFDPAALSRRDGGSEAQQAADDFTYFVDKLNLTPEQAARRMIDSASPEKKQARKALEPAAKEFVKEIQQFDLANEFDDSILKGNPDLGFSPGAALGIQAEFVAIAEDQFFASNGDPEIAKNRAVEDMKRLYGVTQVTGRSVVMKHPPEKYWPTSRMGTSALIGGGPGDPSLEYARQQLEADITIMSPDYDKGSIQLVTTPETDAMVKRGELPGYAVLYKDANGVMQTIPGKLWRPVLDKARAFDKQIQDVATGQAKMVQPQLKQQAPYKVQSPQDILSGNDPTFGGRDFVPPPMTGNPTVKEKLDERRKELIDNAPEPTPGNAM